MSPARGMLLFLPAIVARAVLPAGQATTTLAAAADDSPKSISTGTLKAGDVVMVGMFADEPDDFGVLLLKTLPQGETIYVTDNGIDWHDHFYDQEGIVSFTAPKPVPPGTVLKIANFTVGDKSNDDNKKNTKLVAGTGKWVDYNAKGDQTIVYQGIPGCSTPATVVQCSFLTAITSKAWETADFDINSMRSKVPPGLIDTKTAMQVGTQDNIIYSGSLRAGTPEELNAAIMVKEHWTGLNKFSSTLLIPTAFTVVTVPAPSAPPPPSSPPPSPHVPGWKDAPPCMSEAEYEADLLAEYEADLLTKGMQNDKEKMHRGAINCDGTVHVKGDGKPMMRAAIPHSLGKNPFPGLMPSPSPTP